jgi:DNA-binding response OmpR family regulator
MDRPAGKPPRRAAKAPRAARDPARIEAPRSASPDADGWVRPSALVFSGDPAVVDLVRRAVDREFEVDQCDDALVVRSLLTRPGLKLVVVDDEGVDGAAQGWVLAQIRRYAPDTLVAYIASAHDAERELRARSYSVQFYTAKPLDEERTLRVLRSFLRSGR